MTCTTSSKVLYFPIFALAAALTACGDGGVDGTNIVFKTSAIAPGTECANGGTLFEAGLDANNNAVLDTNEISSRAAVCNGASGSGTGPAGPAGPQGPKGDDTTFTIG
jgi:hypothetical protein